MAGVVEGLFGEGRNVGFVDAVGAEAEREADFSEEFGDEVDGGGVGLFIADAHDFEAASGADAAVEAGQAFGVEAHDVRKAEGVGEAVVEFADGGERVREGVGGA